MDKPLARRQNELIPGARVIDFSGPDHNDVTNLVIDFHQWFELSVARQEYQNTQRALRAPENRVLKHVRNHLLRKETQLGLYFPVTSCRCVHVFPTVLPERRISHSCGVLSDVVYSTCDGLLHQN